MASRAASRLFRSLKSPVCASCRSNLHTQAILPLKQPFSTTTIPRKEFIDPANSLAPFTTASTVPSIIPERDPRDPLSQPNLVKGEWEEEEHHHLHIYATKHNTHITLTKPNRDSLISLSAGNLGFKKAGRGSYDAAYQLASFVLSRIQDKGLLTQIKRLELVYRGFGVGREAVTKAILGSEGKNIRNKIVKLSDATRLKFGGTRSRKPRRLG